MHLGKSISLLLFVYLNKFRYEFWTYNLHFVANKQIAILKKLYLYKQDELSRSGGLCWVLVSTGHINYKHRTGKLKLKSTDVLDFRLDRSGLTWTISRSISTYLLYWEITNHFSFE